MSASEPTSSIFVTDTQQEMADKIIHHAFSGGRDNLEEHRKYGANLEVDVSYLYLEFFLDDDEELAMIRDKYKSGEMTTNDVKTRLIQLLKLALLQHQRARAAITDAVVDAFLAPRKLQF